MARGDTILVPGILGQLTKHVRLMRNKATTDAQKKRTDKRYEALTKNWRQTSAKAFMRYIRNDSKTPLASFPDPEKAGERTCDLKQIESLFNKAWERIYNRPADTPPPELE